MGFEIRPLKATSSCMSSTDAATNFDLFSSSAPTSICSRRIVPVGLRSVLVAPGLTTPERPCGCDQPWWPARGVEP